MRYRIFKILIQIPYINVLLISFFLKKLLSKTLWGGTTFADDIEEYSQRYLSSHEIQNSKKFRKLTIDIILSYYLYGTTVQEYFCFGFMEYSHKRRKDFLSNQHKDKRMLSILNNEQWNLLVDKFLFYEKSKTFFHRDVLLIKKNNKQDFIDFCHKHTKFIVKPNDGQCGKGVHILTVNDENEINHVFTELTGAGKYLVEELVIQNELMSGWNSSSINTIRIPSFYKKNKVVILKPIIRMGRHGGIVDNANAGGIFATINEKDGIVESDGFCLSDGLFYQNHPDSNLKIKGWQIPEWVKLMDIVSRLHKQLSDIPYIGFDFAFSDKGWVLIEGNPGEFLSEFCDREGIKNKFDNLLDECLKN